MKTKLSMVLSITALGLVAFVRGDAYAIYEEDLQPVAYYYEDEEEDLASLYGEIEGDNDPYVGMGFEEEEEVVLPWGLDSREDISAFVEERYRRAPRYEEEYYPEEEVRYTTRRPSMERIPGKPEPVVASRPKIVESKPLIGQAESTPKRASKQVATAPGKPRKAGKVVSQRQRQQVQQQQPRSQKQQRRSVRNRQEQQPQERKVVVQKRGQVAAQGARRARPTQRLMEE